MRIGICKLCGLEKELKKSHVIGRGVFKKALEGSTYSLRFDNKVKKVINDQDQWSTYMLCGLCEHELNSKYENYALNVLRNKLKSIKHKTRENHFEIQGVDQEKLMLYLFSIIWRGIESEHDVFKKLNIFHEFPILKEFIKWSVKNNKIVRSECFDLKISKLISNIGIDIGEISFISNFSCQVDKQKRIHYYIVFEGYKFEFFFMTGFGQKLNDIGVLKKNKRILKMPYVEVFSIPELKSQILEMLESKNTDLKT